MTLKQIKLEKFIALRAHIGHQQKILNKTMNSFTLGTQQGTAILNFFYILWSWERASQILTRAFLYRQKFIILSTNKLIPNEWIKTLLEWRSHIKDQKYSNYLGYIGSSWSGGLLSNWSNLWNFSLLVFDNLIKKKHIPKSKYALMKKLSGRVFKGNQPAFPDFLLALNIDETLLHEARLLRIVSMGLVDSNKDLRYSSLPIFGNDDSFLLIEFFLNLIEQSFLLSSREENELFYRLIFKKLKVLIV